MSAWASPPEPSVYPGDESADDDLLTRLVAELLRPLIERWMRSRGVVGLTGGEQLFPTAEEAAREAGQAALARVAELGAELKRRR
jgi:hypothetical protein